MATKYVATTGNNGNDGSEGSPWLTISHGVAQLSAGDTLYIRAGTYTGSTNTIDSQLATVPSGTSGSRIIVSAYPAETVTIQFPSGNFCGIRLTSGGRAYLTFKDLIIDGINNSQMGGGAIYLSDGSNHNRFENVEVKNAADFGVVFSKNNGQANFNEVVGCKIHHNGRLGTAQTNGHGLYVGVSDCLYEDNEVYNNYGYGFHLYDDQDSNVDRNVIRRNKIHDNGTAPNAAYGIVQVRGEDNEIYNNLIYRNRGGIQIYTGAANAQVYNNTIYNNTPDQGILLEFYASAPIVRNNIVYLNGSGIVDNGGTGTPTISDNITTDPSFTNAGADDFTLQSGSAARDTGATIALVTTDFVNVSRPQGSAYDKGAYEFVASAGGTVSAKPRLLPVLGVA